AASEGLLGKTRAPGPEGKGLGVTLSDE
ncbi:MAG: hypothetical protein RIT45_4049, partial [Pseudomonadota bacterium]